MNFANHHLLSLIVSVLLGLQLVGSHESYAEEPSQKASSIAVRHPVLKEPYRQLHTIHIPRSKLGSELQLVIAGNPKGFTGRHTLSEFASGVERLGAVKVVSGINGTFLSTFGDLEAIPRGPLIFSKELLAISTELPTHPTVFVTTSSSLFLGAVKMELMLRRSIGEDLRLGLNAPINGAQGVLFTPAAFGKPGNSSFSMPKNPAGTVYLLKPIEAANLHIGFQHPVATFDSGAAFAVHSTSAEFSGVVPEGHLSLLFWEELPEKSLEDGEVIRLSLTAKPMPEFHRGECYLEMEQPGLVDVRFASGVGKIYVESIAGVPRVPEYMKHIEQKRDPRAALCWSDQELIFIGVDGIRPGFGGVTAALSGSARSVGITPKNLAMYMKNELGCLCGFELDGGKSVTLMHEGKVVNSPATGFEFPTNFPFLLIKNSP